MKTKIVNLLKKNWLFVVVTSLLLSLLFISKCNNTKIKKENELKTIELSTLKDSVTTIIGKNGELTFKLNSIVVEENGNRKALEAAGFEIKKLKEKDVEWRKVNFALQAQIQAFNSGQTVLHDTTIVTKTDTVKQANFTVNDKHLFFKAFIVNKDVKYTYSYQTGISILNTPKGKHTNIVSMYLTDPNAKVTSANSITITHKTRWYEKPWVWGITGLAGGFYLGNK